MLLGHIFFCLNIRQIVACGKLSHDVLPRPNLIPRLNLDTGILNVCFMLKADIRIYSSPVKSNSIQ